LLLSMNAILLLNLSRLPRPSNPLVCPLDIVCVHGLLEAFAEEGMGYESED